jgi:environmental stress-induced protein Ves
LALRQRDARVTRLRATGYRRVPWKNGGGETMEIAVWPAGAGMDDFDWRLSMALVARDGAFSVFAGVDRTLCILDGGGVELRVDDAPARRLTAASEPFAFSGDVPAYSTLRDGPVTDFNVMTRRARWRHAVQRVSVPAGDVRDIGADVQVVFCGSGTISILVDDAVEPLAARDTILLPAPGPTVPRVRAEADAVVYLVTLTSTGPSVVSARTSARWR